MTDPPAPGKSLFDFLAQGAEMMDPVIGYPNRSGGPPQIAETGGGGGNAVYQPSAGQYSGARDAAIFAAMFSGGMRSSTVLGLQGAAFLGIGLAAIAIGTAAFFTGGLAVIPIMGAAGFAAPGAASVTAGGAIIYGAGFSMIGTANLVVAHELRAQGQ